MSGGAGKCQSNGEICLPVGKEPPETVCNATATCTFDSNSGTVNNADCKVENGSREYSLTNVTTLTSKTSQTEKKYCPGGFKKCASDGEYYCASSTGIYTMDASSGTCELNQCLDGNVETNGHCYPKCEDGDVRAKDGNCRKVGAECTVPSQIEGGVYEYNSEGLCEFKNKCKDDKDELVNGDKCQEKCTSDQKRNSEGECKTVGAPCTGSVTNGNYKINRDGECRLVEGKECEQTEEGGYCWFRCDFVNDNQWTYSDTYLSTNPVDADKFANNPKGLVRKVEECPNPSWCGSKDGGEGNQNKGWDYALGGIENPPPYNISKNETWELNAAKTACEFTTCEPGYKRVSGKCVKAVNAVGVWSSGNQQANQQTCLGTGGCYASIPASKVPLGKVIRIDDMANGLESGDGMPGWSKWIPAKDPQTYEKDNSESNINKTPYGKFWILYNSSGAPNLGGVLIPEGFRLRVWSTTDAGSTNKIKLIHDTLEYLTAQKKTHPEEYTWTNSQGNGQMNPVLLQFDILSGYSV